MVVVTECERVNVLRSLVLADQDSTGINVLANLSTVIKSCVCNKILLKMLQVAKCQSF